MAEREREREKGIVRRDTIPNTVTSITVSIAKNHNNMKTGVCVREREREQGDREVKEKERSNIYIYRF